MNPSEEQACRYAMASCRILARIRQSSSLNPATSIRCSHKRGACACAWRSRRSRRRWDTRGIYLHSKRKKKLTRELLRLTRLSPSEPGPRDLYGYLPEYLPPRPNRFLPFELDLTRLPLPMPMPMPMPMPEGFRHVAHNIPETQDDDDGHFINMPPIDDGGIITLPLDLPHVSSNLLLETILEDESSRPHDIPLRDLEEITDNFSDDRILGHGGFGVVYKGILRNGKMIAVKKIVSSLMPGLQKQFESEVRHLMMLKHKNIVRCVGYCYEIKNACLEYDGKYVFAETAERLLCLEYMPKGSLEKYLSDESSGLDWSTRYNIIEGICYGLCHLHVEIDNPIIHLDLKPPNILLNDGMVPKITDFGLSRLLDQQQTICTSSRDGTFGYMAPEFLHGGTVTPKSDIFSFGVIIIEIVTGHRDYPDVTRMSSDGFIELTLERWRNMLQRSPGYGSLERDCEQIQRCIQVGLICVNPDRTKRPTILTIINMLQGSESIDCDISNSAS